MSDVYSILVVLALVPFVIATIAALIRRGRK
jgi:hypothetical protein